jgi:hypothetical protein
MSEAVVYWLFDETCICPRLHGYVGISARFLKRLKDHRDKPPFQHAILLRGAEAECFALEQQLRPHHRIGWNRSKGGPNQGRTLGYRHSEASRANVSAALKGRNITWRDKLATASTGQVHSEASRRKHSASIKGVPKSAAHRAAMSAAAKRRYSRDGERQKTSAVVKAALAQKRRLTSLAAEGGTGNARLIQ